jgi:hypothetical protein
VQGRGGWLQSRLPATAGRVVQKAPVVLGVPTFPALLPSAPAQKAPPAVKRMSVGSQKPRLASQAGSQKQLPPPRS